MKLKEIPKKTAIGLILFYRKVISPHLMSRCRFIPTCSAYGLEAFRTHGFLKGMGLTLWRILRCNPFNQGDIYDPVPPKTKK